MKYLEAYQKIQPLLDEIIEKHVNLVQKRYLPRLEDPEGFISYKTVNKIEEDFNEDIRSKNRKNIMIASSGV